MEDAEGVLSFDFEGDASAASASAVEPVSGGRNFRRTVCKHWLRGLCMKGDACNFLHRYEESRMPVCGSFKLYGECHKPNCMFKHSNEDVKECKMYKLGFCPNGSRCRFSHVKLAGAPPSVEEVVQMIRKPKSSSGHGSSNRFVQNSQQLEVCIEGSIACAVGRSSSSSSSEMSDVQQKQLQQIQQQTNITASPLPQGISRYFIIKSCNPESLELSVRQGIWTTQRSNEAKLNEAFQSVENVILIHSLNRTGHFQGCAKMTSRIGRGKWIWKHADGSEHRGQNFSVKWLKLCQLSFQKTRHLRNPYNENLPVKISRDCQELEPSVGEQLASLICLEPDSELMAVSVAAESRREEEKRNGGENPVEDGEDDDDEEEEEEEEEEESEEEEEDDDDESSGQAQAQGRGRGGGVMWSLHMLPAQGDTPIPLMWVFPFPINSPSLKKRKCS